MVLIIKKWSAIHSYAGYSLFDALLRNIKGNRVYFKNCTDQSSVIKKIARLFIVDTAFFQILSDKFEILSNLKKKTIYSSWKLKCKLSQFFLI